jgi:hypothetical protein
VVALVVALLAWSAWGGGSDRAADRAGVRAADRATSPTGTEATVLLARIPVADPDPALPPYRRAAFGSGWAYDPASGCNTRERVLVAESAVPAVQGARCKVLSGRWTSRYDGVTVTDPAELQVDHLVPLADAWRSGAARWTEARRRRFANDLTDPNTLVAVSSATNESKGDGSPDEWLPPAATDRCRYAADWVEVKARWGLSATRAEHDALARVLLAC